MTASNTGWAVMLNLAGMIPESIVDGPGLRMTIFCQGCPRHCEGCQNPETWEFGAGKNFSVSDVLEYIHQDPLCRGVTLSGGEPFEQAEDLAVMARILKSEGYEIAAYSGYTFEELYRGDAARKKLLSELDILIDGPFLLSKRSLSLNFRGSENQRILNIPASLRAGKAVPETSARWLGKY